MSASIDNDLAELEALLAKEACGEALTDEEKLFLEGNPEAFGWMNEFDLDEIIKEAENRLENNAMVLKTILEPAPMRELRKIAENNGYQVNFNQSKDAIVSELSREIQNAFQRFIQCAIMEDGFELLSMLQLDNAPVNEELMDAFFFYMQKGFVYFYRGPEETELSGLTLSVPAELQRIFIQSKPVQWIDQLGDLDIAYNIMRGLANLYGMYPIRQLKTVWQDLMHCELPERLLRLCLQRITFEKDFVRLRGEELMVVDIYNDRTIEERLREKRIDENFYMPVFHEVMEYAEMEPVAARPEFVPIREFFEERGIEEEKLEQVMAEFHIWFMLGEPVHKMAMTLGNLGVLPDDGDLQFAGKLVPLMIDAAQKSRLWVYKGHDLGRTAPLAAQTKEPNQPIC